MSSSIKRRVDSLASALTEGLGEKLGNKLRGGEVIELLGDLGSGKTTFIRGLARGVGSSDHVASPTFTLSRVYHSDKVTLHHMDFYRLDEAGIMDLEIEELIADKTNVVAIEWAEVSRESLPKGRLLVKFKTKNENHRTIEFDCPKKLSYLIEDLD